MPKAYITSRSASNAWFTTTSRSPHSNQNIRGKQGSCCCVFPSKDTGRGGAGATASQDHGRSIRAEVTASRFGDSVVNINVSYVPQNGHPKIDQKACGFFVGYSEWMHCLSKIARAHAGMAGGHGQCLLLTLPCCSHSSYFKLPRATFHSRPSLSTLKLKRPAS